MKTAKKVLALLLSVLMVFTMVSSSVVAIAETEPAEKTQIEDVENSISNTFDSIKGIIEGVHNLVGGIMSVLGKECVFCDEVHGKTEDTEEPTEPETPPSEPEVPVEPEEPTEPETPVEPEEPTEPEEPKEDEATEDKIDNAFDSIGGLFDSIHNLVGSILAIFGKECPFCDEVHGEDEEGKHTVTFNYNYENAPKSTKLKVNDFITEPELPEREGYAFAGWFIDKEGTQPFYEETIIEKDIELFANWLPITTENIAFLNSGTVEEKLDSDESNASTKAVIVDYTLKKGIGKVVINNAVGIINNIYGKIGSAIDITILGDDLLEKAIIKFNYDENELPDGVSEDDLGIVWFDEDNNKMVLLDNVVVDKENNIVSVETDHFSKYVVVNSKAWVEHWAHKQLVSRIDGNTLRFNIVLCLDDSGSMSGTARQICQQSARNFIDQLVDGDNISVIKFTSSATVLVPYTSIVDNEFMNNKDTIKNKIVLNASGGTNFNNAINAAIQQLHSMPDKTDENEILKNYIVFLSDGQSSVGDSQITELIKWGYNVIAIGVGNSVSAGVLQSLAQKSGGSYAHVSDPSQIGSVFEQIQGEYIGLSIDSDNDGIADLVEKSGMISIDGYIYRTNPNDWDTDGDGRSDGVEMGKYNIDNGCFEIISSPTTPTYDDAGYDVRISVEPQGSYTSTNLEDYKKIKVKAWLDAYGGHDEADDYLSEALYQDLKDVKVQLLMDGKAIATFETNTTLAGKTSSYSQEVILSDLGKHDYSVKVTTANAGDKEATTQYDPSIVLMQNINKKQQDAENHMLNKANSAIKAYAEVVKEKEEAVANAVMVECSSYEIGSNNHFNTGNKVIAPEIQRIMSERILAQANKWAENDGWGTKDAEDVVKEIAKRCAADTDEFDITANGVKYDVVMNTIGNFEAAGFGTLTATNKETGEKYTFVWCSSYSVICSTINSYMDECRVLYEKSVDDVINSALSDAGSILGVDELKKFVKSKFGEHFDAVLSNNGINLGFKFNDLKNCYNYYEKAKKAISSANNDLTNTNKLNKAITNLNSFLTAANDL